MTAQYPGATPTLIGLYEPRNNVLIQTTAIIDAVVTTIPILDTSNLPVSGYVTFTDGTNEIVFYTSKDATNLLGVTRGADGSLAQVHANAAPLEMRWNADYHVRQNEEIIAIGTDLRAAYSVEPDDSAAVAGVASSIEDRLDMYATRIKQIISNSDWKDAVVRPLNTVNSDVLTRVLKAGDIMTGDLTFSDNTDGIVFTDGDVNTVKVSAPSNITANYVLTVPATQGVADTTFLNNGSGVLSFGFIANANVDGSAAIAYSKLNLTGNIINADINASAAIAYSKLNLTGNIINGDIDGSAGIALTKLAALTVSRATETDGSGFIVASSITSTELGFLSSVSSSIQTQLNAKLNDNGDTITGNLVFSANTVNAVWTDSGVNTVSFSAPATISTSYVVKWPTAQGALNEFLQNDGSGNLTWAAPAGSGTVNSGVSQFFAFYPGTGTTVDDQTLFSVSGNNLIHQATVVGGNLDFTIDNPDNTDTASNARLIVQVGGTSAGDAVIQTVVPSGTTWTFGVDNSDGDAWKLNNSATLVIGSTLQITTGNQIMGLNGSAASPTWTFINSGGNGLFLNSVNNWGLSRAGGSVMVFSNGGIEIQDDVLAVADDTHSLGTASFRWADVRSVLINGADYGFQNGWVIREYPCSAEDIHTKSAKWMRENSSKGIQFLNMEQKQVVRFEMDGIIHAGGFKTFDGFDVVAKVKSNEEKIAELKKQIQELKEAA